MTRHQAQDVFSAVLTQLAQDLRRVVHRHGFQQIGDLLVWQGLDQRPRDLGQRFIQHFGCCIHVQQPEDLDRLILVQQVDHVGNVRRVQRLEELSQRVLISGIEQVFDLVAQRFQSGGDLWCHSALLSGRGMVPARARRGKKVTRPSG